MTQHTKPDNLDLLAGLEGKERDEAEILLKKLGLISAGKTKVQNRPTKKNKALKLEQYIQERLTLCKTCNTLHKEFFYMESTNHYHLQGKAMYPDNIIPENLELEVREFQSEVMTCHSCRDYLKSLPVEQVIDLYMKERCVHERLCD